MTAEARMGAESQPSGHLSDHSVRRQWLTAVCGENYLGKQDAHCVTTHLQQHTSGVTQGAEERLSREARRPLPPPQLVAESKTKPH